MGTLVTITLYARDGEVAVTGFRRAFARIAALNRSLSDYDPSSEVSRLCATGEAGPDLRAVLRRAERVAKASGGAFDVTSGPLTQLWREARKRARPPGENEIEEARRRTGWRLLKGLRCTVPGMRVDLGGIAKGYAAGAALRELRRAGIRQALVAVSGDVAAGDAPPGRSAWRVEAQGRLFDVARGAISTSGDESQVLIYQGTRYSHIVDPRTGRALENSRSVTVLAKDPALADALATACSVLDEDAARRLVREFGGRFASSGTKAASKP
jgi:thiamine biosynthesis lipoprotein